MFYKKKSITFYEKSGCLGNKKQKELLKANGIEFEVKSMLDTKWDFYTLNSFFKDLDKKDIINEFAPKIKSGEINIGKYSKDELVSLMLEEPILIKRPLIVIDDIKICGFDVSKLNKVLNLNLDSKKKIGTCQSGDSCKNV